MSDRQRQIIAIGGGGFYRDSENLALERYIVQQTGTAGTRVAFVPTASAEPDSYLVSFYTAFLKLGCRPSHLSFFKRTPDLRALLLNQDVIFVGGGNTRSMLAVWREWGVPEILREAWESGIVLTGVSAGAICWFEQGVTDSWPVSSVPSTVSDFCRGVVAPITTVKPIAAPRIIGCWPTARSPPVLRSRIGRPFTTEKLRFIALSRPRLVLERIACGWWVALCRKCHCQLNISANLVT